MKPAPTLQDVAREAGVSLATASRVINGSTRRVAETYREVVLAAAHRIGYSPNLSAQMMAKGTSRVAALLLSDIADPYFSIIASGVARATAEADLLVTMAVTERDDERELALLRELRGLRPRFVILAGSRRAEEPRREELIQELEAVQAGGGEVVIISCNDLPFSSVNFENQAGAEALAKALHAQGHRKFSVLTGPRNLLVARERVAGFLEGLKSFGIALPPERLFGGEFSREGGRDAMTRLLETIGTERQAVFAVNDVMAIGAMQALREAGMLAPEPIAIAGFDDIPMANDAFPALTTVQVDLFGIGQRAVALALGRQTRTFERLSAKVVLRKSTSTG